MPPFTFKRDLHAYAKTCLEDDEKAGEQQGGDEALPPGPQIPEQPEPETNDEQDQEDSQARMPILKDKLESQDQNLFIKTTLEDENAG